MSNITSLRLSTVGQHFFDLKMAHVTCLYIHLFAHKSGDLPSAVFESINHFWIFTF